MTRHAIHELTTLGQSAWYDFIKRDLLTSGKLAGLIADDSLRGMTSNPTIFEKAIAGSELYDEEIRASAGGGGSDEDLYEAVAIEDVRRACDIFAELYESTDRADGFVSLEVSPRLAHDTAGTVSNAKRLWTTVGRPNLMIKIPGTLAGIPAIEDSIAAGLNVNVTLLFSVERHSAVIDAYFRGLERRVSAGEPVGDISSVASFFVSRVDTAVDKRLRAAATPAALALVAKIAIDNARLAYELFESRFRGPRWEALAAKGARVQRPLWASTSTKDPALPDVYYVEALVAPDTVNTLPPETFDAYRDHGHPSVRIREELEEGRKRIASLRDHGVDFAAVLRELEDEGVRKFDESFGQLLAAVGKKRAALGAS